MASDSLILLLLVLVLAAGNGANDVSKGVATLIGSGATQARRAILWGTLCTVAGGLSAIAWGSALAGSFGSGFTAPGFRIDLTFLTATLAGASLWLLIATRTGLPVSTTHALLGGLVGAVLASTGAEGLHAAAVANKALLPLLLSPVIAIALCGGVLLVARYVTTRIPPWRDGCCPREDWLLNPFVCANGNSPAPPRWQQRCWTTLHWLSSGTTSFARGLNDTPKIAAFLLLAAAITPGSALALLGTHWLIVLVVAAMGAGSLWGGYRVLQVLAHRITPMNPATGLVANAGTSLLVLFATPLGLPVSTTHVSAGALIGIRWANRTRPAESDALRGILLAWLATLPASALLAALCVRLLGYSSGT